MTNPLDEARWFGWHFLRAPGVQRNGAPVAADGEVETCDGPLEICNRGLHASADPIHALKHAPGWTLRRVELLGEREDRDDKAAALSRRVLWTASEAAVRPVVLEWACWCAEQALALVEDDTEEKQVAILAGLLALEAARDPSATREDRRAAAAAAAAYADAAYAAAYAADAAADADAAYAAAAAAYADAYADAARAEMRSRLSAELERRLLALAPVSQEAA
jgi:hypothetical protein